MDIALVIPAFFDHAPEYLGREMTEGRLAYVLRVVLPMGGEARYWIDAETFLPHKVSLPDWDYEQFLGDWEVEETPILPSEPSHRTPTPPRNRVLQSLRMLPKPRRTPQWAGLR